MRWVVLLEAVKADSTALIDVDALQQLVAAVGGMRRGALWSGERYALHVAVEADSAAVAARSAVDEWEGASRQLGLALWTVVRLETLTEQEFERDCRLEEFDGEALTPMVQGVDDSGRAAADALLRRAFHDRMTGLPNFGLFRCHMERALAAMVTGPCPTLLLVDVDDFAVTNRRIGRQAADSVLITLAKRLGGVAAGNIVGRLGGDQFGILVEPGSADAVVSLAARIVEGLPMAAMTDGSDAGPTVSVGIALAAHGDSGADLLWRAGAALRTAQQRGGNPYETYSAAMADADVGKLQAERDAASMPDASA